MKLFKLLFIFLFISPLILQAQNIGFLNPDFNEIGWDTIDANDNGLEANVIIVQEDGKILVCAIGNFSSEGYQGIILRYNPDGTIDTEFGGGDGMVRTKDDASIDLYINASGVSLQEDGKIIIAGDCFYNTERIMRLNTDGSLDESFGDNGYVDFTRGNREYIYQCTMQSDDKIIICGLMRKMINDIQQRQVFLWRLSSNGEKDLSFGIDGEVSYALPSLDTEMESYLMVNNLNVLPNNQIVINHSYSFNGFNYVTLRRLNADGTADNSFGNNSYAFKSLRDNQGTYTYSNTTVTETGDYISLFTVRDTINSNDKEYIFKFNHLGIEDESFIVPLGTYSFKPNSSKVQAVGNKIYSIHQIDNIPIVSCFNLDGSASTAFGNNGSTLINTNNIPQISNIAFKLSDNGQIYFASTNTNPENSDIEQILTANVNGFPYESPLNINPINENKFSVFPNPASEILYFDSSEKTTNHVIIFDMMGRNVKEINLLQSNVIDISDLTNGCYFLRFDNSANTQKFIKY